MAYRVPELQTARLTLRHWRPDDLPPLAAMYADAEVMRYIGDGSVRNWDETAASIASMERDWREHGYGLFAVELRAGTQLAGWVGLSVPHFLPEVLPAVEIGWRLGRGFWGCGYATEAAREVMRFGFDDVGLDRIISIRHVRQRRLGARHDQVGNAPGPGDLGTRARSTGPGHGAHPPPVTGSLRNG